MPHIKVDLNRAKSRLGTMREQEALRNRLKELHPLKKGENKLRLMPPTKEGADWAREAAYHHNLVEKRALLCLKETYGQACPVCEQVEALRSTRDSKDRELAKEYSAKFRCFVNALILDGEGKGEVKVVPLTWGIYKELLTYFSNEEYGDITDPEGGSNILITKTGEGLQTEYDLKIARKPSPVEGFDKLTMPDLEEFVGRDRLTYEKMAGVVNGTETLEDRGAAATSTPAPTADEFGSPAAEKKAPDPKPEPTKTETKVEKGPAADEFGAGGKSAPAAQNKAQVQTALDRLRNRAKSS